MGFFFFFYSLWSLGCSFFLDKTCFSPLLFFFFLGIAFCHNPAPLCGCFSGPRLDGSSGNGRPSVSAMWSASPSTKRSGASVVQAGGPSLNEVKEKGAVSQRAHQGVQWSSWWQRSSQLNVTFFSIVLNLQDWLYYGLKIPSHLKSLRFTVKMCFWSETFDWTYTDVR